MFMTLGQKIKKLRIDKGYTQKDLADQLNVTFQTVSKWEGDINEPDLATIRQMAKLFSCSIEYLISEEEQEKEEKNEQPTIEEKAEDSNENTKIIVVHHNDLHVCAKCGKEIPEDDLVSEDITKKERHGKRTRTVSVGQTFYHKECLEEVKKERERIAYQKRKYRAYSCKKKCFGWGIAAGAVGLIVSLIIFICNRQYVHPALGVVYSILIGYGLFAMIYCILSGSYIGDVFLWCATRSIKFPGLIFTWDIDGIVWVIGMKILFMILGFIAGLFTLAFGVVLSAVLGGFSFPFVLKHNIDNDYSDAL